MKIARKFTLVLALSTLVILVLQAALRLQRERSYFETDMMHDHHVLGRALAAAFRDAWRRAGHDEAVRLIERANTAENHVHLRWVRLSRRPGQPYAPEAPSVDKAAVARGQDVTRVVRGGAHAALFTYVPVSVKEASDGAIELSESLKEERAYMRTSLRNTLATTGVLGIMFIFAAVPLGNWLVGRPMRLLVGKARRVGAGDLSGALAIERNDEMGELAAEMNAMTDQLAKTQSRLAAETEARIAALAQLRHADRLNTVGKLASGLAHELGSPLNVIAGRAKMIETETSQGPEAVNAARIISEQAERMTVIIRQVLGYARRRGPRKARHEIEQVARKSLELLRPLAEKQGVTLQFQDQGVHTEFEFDADQIHQVLTNLITNGIQASERGGTLEVSVGHRGGTATGSLETRSDLVWIRVRDHGATIPEEVRARMFEPFFTTKPPGEGTGLGLSVSHGIVSEHGGWIDVQSGPGRGTTLTVHLPAQGLSATGARAPTELS